MRGLPKTVKVSLEKARDCALLAVEVYNKPAVKFKSGAYITLMIIAWTSLFHAIFFKRKTKPFYKTPNGRFKLRDGDFDYWDLRSCLNKFYMSDSMNPIKINLELFIPLRNRIEHKSLPEIDSDIFGECQAMLLNFDYLLEQQFGTKFCLRESLSFSLQFYPSCKSLSHGLKSNPSSKSIIDFIKNYRSSVATQIYESDQYTFKAILIQVANHNSKDALPIQFLHFDKLSEDQKAELGRFVAMVKFRDGGTLPQTVVVSNGSNASPIRITNDNNAPAYKVVNPNDTHPYRQKEIISSLNNIVKNKLTSFHLKCVRQEYNIDSQRPDFFYKPKYASPQFSQVFLDWLIDSYNTDNSFFDALRLKYLKTPGGGDEIFDIAQNN
jgi:Protein of unknown function (DUF3644)/EC042_2821-lke REase